MSAWEWNTAASSSPPAGCLLWPMGILKHGPTWSLSMWVESVVLQSQGTGRRGGRDRSSTTPAPAQVAEVSKIMPQTRGVLGRGWGPSFQALHQQQPRHLLAVSHPCMAHIFEHRTKSSFPLSHCLTAIMWIASYCIPVPTIECYRSELQPVASDTLCTL